MAESNENLRAIMSGVVVGVLIQVILSLIRDVYNSMSQDSTTFLSDNIYWIIIPLIVTMAYYFLARHARKQQMANAPIVFASYGDPDQIMGSYGIPYFGVNWGVIIGSSMFGGKPYAIIRGLYCPKCDYELDRYQKLSLFGWKDKYYWRCEPCNLLYRRQDKTLFREDDIVEKLAMREYRKEINQE